MAEFVESKDDYNCTYFISGDRLVHQAIYCCHTCNENAEIKNSCCCAGCAETCHEGHDVEYLANGLAYCDCGKGQCRLFQSTKERFQSSLLAGEDFLYGGEVPLAIADRPFEVHHFSELNKEFLELAAQQCDGIVKHSKETFWVGCNWNFLSDGTSPSETTSCRVQLEEFALYIFHYHIKSLSCRTEQGLSFNPELSGAEWWIQIKDLTDPEMISPSIDLHYDKDEDIAEHFDVGIFPSISTVTYLTEQTVNNSQPTVLFPATANDPIGMEMRECYLSYPVFGKHISFDGRLLHGAPANSQLRDWRGGTHHHDSLDSRDSPVAKKRITFLVNIWLNHHPANIQPLPDEIVNSIRANASVAPLSVHETLALTPAASTEIQTCVISLSDHDHEKGKNEMKSAEKHPLGSGVIRLAEADMSQLLLPFVSKDESLEKDVEDPELMVEMYLPPWESCVREERSGEQGRAHSFHFKFDSFPAQIVSPEGDEEEKEEEEEEGEELDDI
jgi:hypothetical protein